MLASGGNILSSLKLSVAIPCSGHASLITGEIKSLSGINSVQFSLPNIFDVKYDPTKTTKQQILTLDVFKTYKAIVLSETSNQQLSSPSINSNQQLTTDVGGSCGGGSCGCGCGGGR
jgi:hypothetical protein